MRFVAVLALTLLPSSAWAQTHDWSDLSVEDRSTVYVEDTTGRETAGQFVSLDTNALVLLVEGTEQRLLAAEVVRVEKRGDSLRNGFLIGAVIGAGLGLTSGSGGPLAGAVGFGAIGLGIDALKTGRTTLYEAPGSDPSVRAPLVGRGAAVLSFRW